jgi:hypothetical protein
MCDLQISMRKSSYAANRVKLSRYRLPTTISRTTGDSLNRVVGDSLRRDSLRRTSRVAGDSLLRISRVLLPRLSRVGDSSLRRAMLSLRRDSLRRTSRVAGVNPLRIISNEIVSGVQQFSCTPVR